jgi:type IV pilus biogenesis protein CpaD/CtpE
LAKIKFDRPNVEYEQPIYMAVTEALKRYPEAEFDLVAVNPTSGNAAEVAIETTRARRNAEKVLRTLTQMGLDTNRIDLSYNESSTATSSEVHLFVK